MRRRVAVWLHTLAYRIDPHLDTVTVRLDSSSGRFEPCEPMQPYTHTDRREAGRQVHDAIRPYLDH